MNKTWLFLDFDGVICDSQEESYRSSWIAWSGDSVDKKAPPSSPIVEEGYYNAFRGCRPFVRSGEDFVVLHDLLHHGKRPRTQQEFDEALRETGPAGLALLKANLYAVRDAILTYHRRLWLSWNPLYPGMRDALAALAERPQTFVLSTKKSEFIHEILQSNGVDWPVDRILYTADRKKLRIVEELSHGEPSILIDDQIDHLDFFHPSCDCRLAAWGFVEKAWIDTAPASLGLDEALTFLDVLSTQ